MAAPTQGPLRVAILVYSLSGNTLHVGIVIRDRLASLGAVVEIKDITRMASQPPYDLAQFAQLGLEGFDCIIIGSFAWAMNAPPALSTFARTVPWPHKPYYFFSTGQFNTGRVCAALSSAVSAKGGICLGSLDVLAPSNTASASAVSLSPCDSVFC